MSSNSPKIATRLALSAAVAVLWSSGCETSPAKQAVRPTDDLAPSRLGIPAFAASEELLTVLTSGSVDRERLEELLRSGADPNAVQGNTLRNPALLVAAMNLKTEAQIAPVLSTLIQAGADVDGRNANGVTAACAGITFNDHSAEVLRVLLDHGANPNLILPGRMNLLTAAIINSPCRELVPMVLATDVDVNLANAQGLTPLALSISGCTSMCDAILARGGTADASFVMRNGRTVLEFAEFVAENDRDFARSATLSMLRAQAAHRPTP